MMRIHLDYCQERVFLHTNPDCGDASQAGDCLVRMNVPSLSSVLERWSKDIGSFSHRSCTEAVWLEIDFHDDPFETAVLHYALRLLRRDDRRLPEYYLEKHC